MLNNNNKNAISSRIFFLYERWVFVTKCTIEKNSKSWESRKYTKNWRKNWEKLWYIFVVVEPSFESVVLVLKIKGSQTKFEMNKINLMIVLLALCVNSCFGIKCFFCESNSNKDCENNLAYIKTEVRWFLTFFLNCFFIFVFYV